MRARRSPERRCLDENTLSVLRMPVLRCNPSGRATSRVPERTPGEKCGLEVVMAERSVAVRCDDPEILPERPAIPAGIGRSVAHP